jgi:hypothetical protein
VIAASYRSSADSTTADREKGNDDKVTGPFLYRRLRPNGSENSFPNSDRLFLKKENIPKKQSFELKFSFLLQKQSYLLKI